MTKEKMVWILEDDSSVQFVYADMLKDNYPIRFFSSLKEFANELKKVEAAANPKMPTLILADIKLSDVNFLEYLTANGMKMPSPFVVVSGLDDSFIVHKSFEIGALDYLTKPFKRGELLAKLDRWTSLPTHASVFLDPLRLSAKTHLGSCQLTLREFQIFSLVHASPTKFVTRNKIVEKLWGNSSGGHNAFQVHLSSLRGKISALGLRIRFDEPDKYSLLIQ